MQIDVPRESIERLELPVESSLDPATFTVEWAFTDTDTPSQRPGDVGAPWIGGSWKAAGAQGGTLGWVRTALTPMIGTNPDLADGYWQPHLRIGAGAETPVFTLEDIIHVT